jgi:SAM-dependent methyltransferase
MSGFNGILARRLQYYLSPQFDLYKYIAENVATGERIVDIGFGTGFGAIYIHNKTGAHVTGVEIDRDAIMFAMDCLPGVRWLYGDIGRGIEYIGKDFDTALMIEVLEHVSDWQLALRHIHDILKPGGRLIISARNANADLRKNDLHEREWHAQEFVAALKHYFESVELFDYTLKNAQDETTRMTPLVAIARKEGNA